MKSLFRSNSSASELMKKMPIGNALKNLKGSSEGGGLPTHGIIIVLTISAEEIASFFMFECPCDQNNRVYGQGCNIFP